MVQYMCHFCGTTNPEWELYFTAKQGQKQLVSTKWMDSFQWPWYLCRFSWVQATAFWGKDWSKTIKQKSTCTLPEYCGLFCVIIFPQGTENHEEITCISWVLFYSDKYQLMSCRSVKQRTALCFLFIYLFILFFCLFSLAKMAQPLCSIVHYAFFI